MQMQITKRERFELGTTLSLNSQNRSIPLIEIILKYRHHAKLLLDCPQPPLDHNIIITGIKHFWTSEIYL